MKKLMSSFVSFMGLLAVWCCANFSCASKDDVLAPYAGTPDMSEINIEPGTFSPKVTWVGGYAAAFGVNQGETARLDSSLVMLVQHENDQLRYPVTFGRVPEGAQEISSQFGGTAREKLKEDHVYTFWVMKNDLWKQASGHRDKILMIDAELTADEIKIQGDTLFAAPSGFTLEKLPLDVFINFLNVRVRGRLALLTLIQTDTSNSPIITWDIQQPGVTDTLIAALGLVKSTQYDPLAVVWEVWSEDTVGEKQVYGKSNIISSPLLFGNSFPGVHVFYEYPAAGLERNQKYYFWIANNRWDGITHSRSADYYAYITFDTL